MRGKESPQQYTTGRRRITPAHAGKSRTVWFGITGKRDHPRTCGEKTGATINNLRQAGSPPHMRGKDTEKRRLLHEARITPAHAGKSRCARKRKNGKKDHPRTCGEKVDGGRNRSRQMGSPPHMRGKVSPFPSCSLTGRITPAYAGKSMLTTSGDSWHTDHPRICGEKGKPEPLF